MTRITRSAWILAAAMALAASLGAQDKDKAKKPAAKHNPPDEKAMMEAWQKASTPGDMHKKLDAIVGSFDADVRMWMDPSKPPEDSKGSSVNTWVLGNRYVEQRYEGTMMGQPFNGIGYTGYDNVQKKYVSMWMDTGGTGIMTSTPTLDPTGKKMTSKSTVYDPMTGKPTTVESKMTFADNDHHAFEMWGKTPAGKSFKMMEITYIRKK